MPLVLQVFEEHRANRITNDWHEGVHFDSYGRHEPWRHRQQFLKLQQNGEKAIKVARA